MATTFNFPNNNAVDDFDVDTKTGDIIQPEHINDLRKSILAIENNILNPPPPPPAPPTQSKVQTVYAGPGNTKFNFDGKGLGWIPVSYAPNKPFAITINAKKDEVYQLTVMGSFSITNIFSDSPSLPGTGLVSLGLSNVSGIPLDLTSPGNFNLGPNNIINESGPGLAREGTFNFSVFLPVIADGSFTAAVYSLAAINLSFPSSSFISFLFNVHFFNITSVLLN